MPEFMTTIDDIARMTFSPTCKLVNHIWKKVKVKLPHSTTSMILYLLFWLDDFEGAMLYKHQKFCVD